jgi:serine O-acetyltransferase
MGVVIHPNVVIGSDVMIFHQVTIGDRMKGGGVPRVGNGVLIGAGAKILGDLSIAITPA